MKITTDVNSSGLMPAGNVLPRSSTDNRTNISDAKLAQDVITKLQRDKSVIDALAIAQSSRELVQKALNVSSRLMSLASEAMVTGHVNVEEVSTQVSVISGSMGSYGESFNVPVQGTPVPADNVQKKLDESFVKIKEKAAQLISGAPVAQKDFEPVAADLQKIGSELDVQIKKYSAELGNTKKIEDFNFNYQNLNRNTAGLVVSNPAEALGTQGNISYEAAGRLTGA